ncbi:hypothetical protein M8J76_009107 [Diaphorina citri]|nr:hypothetical protein M8J76_009107 [Diaphorina citri]
MDSCESHAYNVVDFDWTLKWIFGTSTLANHQEPLVNLIFHVKPQDQLVSGDNPSNLYDQLQTDKSLQVIMEEVPPPPETNVTENLNTEEPQVESMDVDSEINKLPDNTKSTEPKEIPDVDMETEDNIVNPEQNESGETVAKIETSDPNKNIHDETEPQGSDENVDKSIPNHVEDGNDKREESTECKDSDKPLDICDEQSIETKCDEKSPKETTEDQESVIEEIPKGQNVNETNVDKDIDAKEEETKVEELVETEKTLETEPQEVKETRKEVLKKEDTNEDTIESIEDVQKYIDGTSNEDKSSSVPTEQTEIPTLGDASEPDATVPNEIIQNPKDETDNVKSDKLSDNVESDNLVDSNKAEISHELSETQKEVQDNVMEVDKTNVNTSNKDEELQREVEKLDSKEEASTVPSETSSVVKPSSDSIKHPILTAVKKQEPDTSKTESPKRKVSARSRRNPVIPLLPNLHYLDNETNFGGFYPEYFDSTIYMYRSYWCYVQEEFNIPCRPLPPYKTDFYLNFMPSAPVMQSSSGRSIKKREFTPSVPSSHQVKRDIPSAKKEINPKKESPAPPKKDPSDDKGRQRYRLPLEKFGWKREIVYRGTSNSPAHSADVYYYSPAGKKLRSIREIIDTLPEDHELKPFHFTFVKEKLGFGSPLEVSREAVSRTLQNCDEDTPKKAKASPAVNRKVFFDKTPSGGKPKADGKMNMNGKLKKSPVSLGGVKRTHDEMESEDPADKPTIKTNGDVKSKTAERSKSVGKSVSPLVKSKSTDGKIRKSDSTGLKKPQQAENKVPNAMVTKHKLENHTKAPGNKKRRIEPADRTYKLSPPVRPIVRSNKNLMNDLSNQFSALVYLCRYLRVEDLLRVARVNRMFNAAAHSHVLWQVVKLKNSKVRDWNGLAECLNRHGTHTLDMLKMIGSADPDENDEIWNRFYKVIGKIHSLRRLELGRVTAAEILNAASNCSKNLTEFSVIAQKLATIDLKLFQGLPNLEILQLRSFESKREHGLIMMNIPLLSHMRHLRHLSLTGVKNLKSYQVNVFKDFPPLASLELGDCTKLDERFPEASLAPLTSLVRLRLEMVQGNMANKFVETIATLPRLRTLELINIDTKKGFDEVFGRLSHIEHLLIFPTYITQSSTTNWLVLSGLSRLKTSLKFLTWGLTQELLRVTTLFIEQWNAQLNLDDGVSRLDPEELKKTIVESNSIPVMKPLPELFEAVHTAGKAEGTTKQNISELDILPIDELKTMLERVLCETKIKLITVPVSSTTRIYLPNN